MIRRFRTGRGPLASPLCALLLLLSVAVPLMERADAVHEPVVESKHDPSSCPTPHDHSICTQFGANHAFAANASAAPASIAQHPVSRAIHTQGPCTDPFSRSAPARAPPTD